MRESVKIPNNCGQWTYSNLCSVVVQWFQRQKVCKRSMARVGEIQLGVYRK